VDFVAGVDGCRGGWAVALAPVGGGALDVRVVATFAEVLALRTVAIAIDMPIGLADSGRRACDIEARRRLGPRRSSVFPAPLRPMLEASTYQDALAIAGLSKQAYHLIPKVREVDALMTPRRQRTIVEAHPELCFAELLGHPCRAPKRTAEGRAERQMVVKLTIDRPPTGAAWDDVLDACALVETAHRLVNGNIERLGDRARDRRGLRCEIVL
jgi:predicted RNase H-like nuclease